MLEKYKLIYQNCLCKTLVKGVVVNFEFYNPTKVLFGKGKLEKLGEVVKAFGNKALLVTGGGSIKRNGTFDKAIDRKSVV